MTEIARRLTIAVAALVVSAVALAGQTPAPPAFEAASLKRNVSPQSPTFFQAANDRLSVGNVPLRMLIQLAYRVNPEQVAGGPDWIGKDRFDIVAKAASPFDPQTQWQLMLRSLLAERFQLRVRTESKEVTGFALVLARSDGRLGRSLRRADTSCAELRARTDQPAADPCGLTSLASATVRGAVGVRGLEIGQIAAIVERDVRGPVTDETGLAGAFDWELKWTPQNFIGQPFDRERFSSIDPDGPAVGTALEEQLGLRLVPRRTALDVIVIEQVERPAPD